MTEKKYDASVFAKTLLAHTESIENIKESQAMMSILLRQNASDFEQRSKLIDAKLDRLLERRTETSSSPPTVEPPPPNPAAVPPQETRKVPSKGFLDHFFAQKAAPVAETPQKKGEAWLDKVDILTLLAFAAGLMLGLIICLIVFVALRF